MRVIAVKTLKQYLELYPDAEGALLAWYDEACEAEWDTPNVLKNMIKPIKTEAQYDAALARIFALIQSDVEPGSVEGDELEILSLLVKTYEQVYYPICV